MMMTTEEKAKAYDEALERAKKWYNAPNVDKIPTFGNRVIEEIFPEFKEDEDDKMKKIISDILLIDSDEIREILDTNNVLIQDINSWLEKQSKNNMGISETTKQELEDNLHKSLEKETPESCNEFLEKQGKKKPLVVPKFRVGDTIKNKKTNKIFTISDYSLLCKYYHDINHYYEIKFSEQDDWELIEQKPANKIEPKFHEGDWVVDKDGIVKQILSYKDCIYKHTNGYSSKMFEDEWRMWDITKDAKDGDVLVDEDNNISIYKEIEGICWYSYIYLGCNNRLYGFSIGGSHIQNNTKPATKEQRDLLFKKMHESGYEWDAEKKELKKIEQKSSWSEEDETKIKSIIAFLKSPALCCMDGNKGIIDENIKYLKSLKDRVQPQPKQEWSEEDIDNLNRISVILNDARQVREWWKDERLITKEESDKLITFLKSLRPQNTWKPSDEQMDALHYVTNFDYGGHKYTLVSLYDQLKKLKG